MAPLQRAGIPGEINYAILSLGAPDRSQFLKRFLLNQSIESYRKTCFFKKEEKKLLSHMYVILLECHHE